MEGPRQLSRPAPLWRCPKCGSECRNRLAKSVMHKCSKVATYKGKLTEFVKVEQE